jgi:hypothetical protein
MIGMNGNSGKGTLSKRLETIERQISFKKPRVITIMVDGNSEPTEAETAILQNLDVVDADLVIRLQHYGGKDPNLPRLHSVVPMVG